MDRYKWAHKEGSDLVKRQVSGVDRVDWSKLPDIVVVALLACAFASVARRNYTRVSGLWLTGWLVIVLHFIAFLFMPSPGVLGETATLVGLSSLTWAGLLFMWASVPYRQERSSRWMFGVLAAVNAIYMVALISPGPGWLVDLSAVLLGAAPLALTLKKIREFNHPLRWITTLLNCGLVVFLLAVQHRPGNGVDLAIDGILFTVYFNCCIHF